MMPSLLLILPPVLLLCIAILFSYWLFVSVLLASAGHPAHGHMHYDVRLQWFFWYHTIGLLWTAEVVLHLGFCASAGAVVSLPHARALNDAPLPPVALTTIACSSTACRPSGILHRPRRYPRTAPAMRLARRSGGLYVSPQALWRWARCWCGHAHATDRGAHPICFAPYQYLSLCEPGDSRTSVSVFPRALLAPSSDGWPRQARVAWRGQLLPIVLSRLLDQVCAVHLSQCIHLCGHTRPFILRRSQTGIRAHVAKHRPSAPLPLLGATPACIRLRPRCDSRLSCVPVITVRDGSARVVFPGRFSLFCRLRS